MSNELDTIVGIADSVSVDGMEVKVSPLKVRDIPPFSRALKPILPQVSEMLSGKVDTASIINIMTNGNHLIEAVAIATGKESEWIESLNPDSVGDYMASSSGERVMVETIRRNAQTIKRMLV